MSQYHIEGVGTDPKNLIVNYIPTPVTDAELRQLFEQFGEVDSARIIVDRVTNHPKGYGFVKFKNEEAALVAIEKMNGFEIHNKRLKVTPARGPAAGSGSFPPDQHQRGSMPIYGGGPYGHPAPPPPPPPPPPQPAMATQAVSVDPVTGMATIQVPIQFLQAMGGVPQLVPQQATQTILVQMPSSGGQAGVPLTLVSQNAGAGFVPAFSIAPSDVYQTGHHASPPGSKQSDGTR